MDNPVRNLLIFKLSCRYIFKIYQIKIIAFSFFIIWKGFKYFNIDFFFKSLTPSIDFLFDMILNIINIKFIRIMMYLVFKLLLSFLEILLCIYRPVLQYFDFFFRVCDFHQPCIIISVYIRVLLGEIFSQLSMAYVLCIYLFIF